jgi:hypothetical protein
MEETSHRTILQVPDAETYQEAVSNFRKVWCERHREKCKRRGRPSKHIKAMQLICEAWLELRQRGKVTRYKMAQRAHKRDISIKLATFNKYARLFMVTLLAASAPNQLTQIDRKYLEKSAPSLGRKLTIFQQALAHASGQSTGNDYMTGAVSSDPASLAEQFAQTTVELVASIEEEVRKMIPSLPRDKSILELIHE